MWALKAGRSGEMSPQMVHVKSDVGDGLERPGDELFDLDSAESRSETLSEDSLPGAIMAWWRMLPHISAPVSGTTGNLKVATCASMANRSHSSDSFTSVHSLSLS